MAPGPKDPLEDPSGKLLEEFRLALVSAFPEGDALSAFAEDNDLVEDMEGDLGRIPATQYAARALLKHLKSAGTLRKALTAALSRQPGNPALKAFARKVGATAPVQIAAPDETSIESFDLRTQEKQWRDAFGLAGFKKRMFIFVARDFDQEVLQPLVERLCRFIVENTGNSVHSSTNVTLRPDLATLQDAIDRVERIRRSLATQPVLIRVHAERAPDQTVKEFLTGVNQRFGAVLNAHLVLLLNVATTWPPADACCELAPWAYEEAELNLWIASQARRLAWSDDLAEEFLQHVRDRSSHGGNVTAGRLYDTLSSAIDFLRTEPDEQQLRDWIRDNA